MAQSAPVGGELIAVHALTIPDADDNDHVNFELASGATRLSDGTIVVGDRYGTGLRFFDSDGDPARTSGRQGEGPGEFSSVDWVGQCEPDRVFAWDQSQGKVTVVDAQGSFVRSFSLPSDRAAAVGLISCHMSGRIALLTVPTNMRPPGRDGTSGHFRSDLLITDTQGRVLRAFENIPAMETRPAGKVTTFGLNGSTVFIGTKDSAAIDVFPLDGGPGGAMALEPEARRPEIAHYRRAIRALVAPSHSRAFREYWTERFMQLPMPEFLTPYHAIYVDPLGTLWVQTSIPGDSTTELQARALDGTLVATVSLPGDFLIYEVGVDYALVAEEDLDTGRQSVRLFSFRRAD